jgi:hypothetical protein
VPPRSAIEEGQLRGGAGSIEVTRAQVTSSALESTIDYLGSIKEGRKSILFVSQTIGQVGYSQQDTIDWLDHAIREANANNVTIYSLDPRGLDMNLRHSDVLISLAENTGGKQFSNNYPADSLKEIVRNSSAFYLLGYTSAKNPADGRFHKIAVRVKRPGVEVKARTGYFAPSLADTDAAAKKTAEHTAPPEITKTLEPLVSAPNVTVMGDMWAGAKPGTGGAPSITAVWTPRASGKRRRRPAGCRRPVKTGTCISTGRSMVTSRSSAPAGAALRHSLIEPDGSRGDPAGRRSTCRISRARASR